MPNLFTRLLGGAGRVRASASPATMSQPDEVKQSRTGPTVALYSQGKPVWTPRDYGALAREGYQRNAIVHRAVNLIAQSAASAPLVLKAEGRELREHPLLDLMARPNPRLGGQAFRETLYAHLLLAGNAYIEAVTMEGAPRELHALRPDRMQVVPGSDGWPMAYDYVVGSRSVRFRQDEDDVPPILHLSLFNPLDDHYGLAPIEAATTALDIHNSAARWNKALLDNAARPSGALIYAAGEGGSLTDAQFDRLKEELEVSFQGATNAGRPLLLDGGLDWKPLSLTPKDMDFVEAKSAAAREIALAFGVPPLLLGLPGDATYANYAEANRAFWRQTLIPLIRRINGDIINWLAPVFGTALSLEPDLDAVEALAAERESLWRRVTAAPFLSDDEKREALGYGIREPNP
jgi:HK97 family phage portal protein